MKLSHFIVTALGVSCSLSSATKTQPSPAPPPSKPRSAPERLDVFSRAIERLHGEVVNPAPYPSTLDGFQRYLTASGVRDVTADELTRPNHPGVAARLGFERFLPAKKWWPRGAALALLTDRLRGIAGEPVHLRNWWRPPSYNANPVVGGAKYGDHPTANAVDLDYTSVSGRIRAERWLRKLDKTASWLGLSLGLGPLTTHVGIGSPRGRRQWHYPGWHPAA